MPKRGACSRASSCHNGPSSGQARLRAVQRLNLTLLIETEHQRLFGRIHIQSHHVGQLLDEAFIARELERLGPVWLQTVGIPDSLHRRRTDVLSRRHRPHAPMGGIRRMAMQGRLDDLLHLFGGDSGFAPASGLVFGQCGRAAVAERLRHRMTVGRLVFSSWAIRRFGCPLAASKTMCDRKQPSAACCALPSKPPGCAFAPRSGPTLPARSTWYIQYARSRANCKAICETLH